MSIYKSTNILMIIFIVIIIITTITKTTTTIIIIIILSTFNDTAANCWHIILLSMNCWFLKCFVYNAHSITVSFISVQWVLITNSILFYMYRYAIIYTLNSLVITKMTSIITTAKIIIIIIIIIIMMISM